MFLPISLLLVSIAATALVSYNTYDDRQLLGLVTEDDRNAFSALYDRYWKKMFVLAFNRTKDKQAAEDIIHDVFASLWINRKKIEINSPENYLAVSVKYAVLSQLKKRIKERELQAAGSAVTLPELSIETQVHCKQVLEIMKTEVEKLPERCRLVFKYSREKGMSVKRIAVELNISPKTVENQLTKALRQLRVATRNFLHLFLLVLFC